MVFKIDNVIRFIARIFEQGYRSGFISTSFTCKTVNFALDFALIFVKLYRSKYCLHKHHNSNCLLLGWLQTLSSTVVTKH